MDISRAVASGHLDPTLIYIVFLYFLLFSPFIPSLIESTPTFVDCKRSRAVFMSFYSLLYQGSGVGMRAAPGLPEGFKGGL